MYMLNPLRCACGPYRLHCDIFCNNFCLVGRKLFPFKVNVPAPKAHHRRKHFQKILCRVQMDPNPNCRLQRRRW